MPPTIAPRLILQSALRPAWALGVVRHGLPRIRGLEPYIDDGLVNAMHQIGYERIDQLRDHAPVR